MNADTVKIPRPRGMVIEELVYVDPDGFRVRVRIPRTEIGPGDEIHIREVDGQPVVTVMNPQMQALQRAQNAPSGYLAGSLGLGLGLGDPFHRGDR